MSACGNNFKGWIWPRDTRPGESWRRNRWLTFKDVLTGKGPDIFVGSVDKDPKRPSRARWSNWGYVFGDTPPDGISFNQIHPIFGADRTNQVYDFRSRRWRHYKGPDPGMWSDRRRCPNKYAKVPLGFRDAAGQRYDSSDLHCTRCDPDFGEQTCWSQYHD